MAMSSSSSRPRRRHLARGYLVAVGGIAFFILAVAVGAGLQITGPPAGFLALGSFALMGLALCAGTALVAVDKGYHVVLGVVLGVFAPLGLLVVAVMPDRGREVGRGGAG